MTTLGSLLATAAKLTKPDRSPDERAALRDALKTLRAAIEELVPGHAVRHSEGQTIPSDIPWIVIFPEGREDTNTTTGYYAVYLFAWDGEYVNLSFGLGTEKVKSPAALRARTTALRELCPDTADLARVPQLTKETGRAADYIKGTVVARVYDPDNMPPEDDLRIDLERFVGFADTAHDSGLRFSPTKEPFHLVYPWGGDLMNPGFLKAHRDTAAKYGAVWWATSTTVAPEKVNQLKQQLASEVPTYAYLCAPGDSWRARLVDITTSTADLEAETEFVHNATPYDGKLAMKMTDFSPMPTSWAGENLFAVSTGKPVTESFASSFTYVHSGFARDAGVPGQPPPAPKGKTLPGATVSVDKDLAALANDSGIPVERLREMYNVLEGDHPQLILAGPPGTGKTWLAKRLAQVGVTASAAAYNLVQFHPTYAYEDFIEGLRPVAKDGAVVFQNEPGHLLQMISALPNGPSTLIIDEMNRANIPSVFGELMYLLEYRDEKVKLRLSGEFALPAEVRFIATMNTADRSIRSVDAALRRRFEYFEVFPDANALSNYYQGPATLEVPDLVQGFEELNSRLAAAIDRHHGIGHSFFMRKLLDAQTLQAIWRRQVRPLIEEYFFDEPNRVDAEFTLTDLWPSQAT